MNLPNAIKLTRAPVTTLCAGEYIIHDDTIIRVTERASGVRMGYVIFSYEKTTGARGNAQWRKDMLVTKVVGS